MKRAKKKLRDIWQTVKSGINRSREAQALPIARAESDGEHLATYCSHPVSVAVWSSTQLWPPHGACTWGKSYCTETNGNDLNSKACQPISMLERGLSSPTQGKDSRTWKNLTAIPFCA